MNKKNLIIFIVILILAIIAGYFIFVYKAKAPLNNVEEIKKVDVNPETPVNNKPEVKNEIPQIKAEGTGKGGTLTICEVKCGDGICETEQNVCKNGIPCGVCAETNADCPQDCK